MPHTFIKDLQPGQQLDDVYIATQPLLRSTTRGDLYIAMYLSDRTGKLSGRMWQATEQVYNSLPKDGLVRIWGRTELYQNTLQIVIDNIQPAKSADVSLEDFLPCSSRDISQMFAAVKKILGQIKSPQLRALVNEFLADAGLMENFCKAPAASQLHHSYLGGLLEHTLNMLQVAVAVLPLYPRVQADLVLTGIFLHDMGKTEELTYEMGFSYTDRGQLLGHITQTILMVDKKADCLAQKGTTIDQTILASLQHIILSHHGEYEFGSPKLPATAEAFMVYYIDDLDAKLNQVTDAIDNAPGDSTWTEWKKALDTRLYRKRVIE
jgi:3'-5' exoribonuclease